MSRYPVKDQVAFVGVGTTGFGGDMTGRSQLSLACEAATQAVGDAGLTARDIDGICGTFPPAYEMVSALGLPAVTHYGNQPPPVTFSVLDAMHAIFSGNCETVLLYHSMFRTPYTSRAAAKDPFRKYLTLGDSTGVRNDPEQLGPPASYGVGYASWASRYMHEYGVGKEAFGYVTINSRTNASRNPLAVRRDPITMEDYLGARMVRDPLSMLDMDIPVDGADAFVLTTAERARDMPRRPVLINAATAGIVARNEEDQTPSLRHHGQHVVVEDLRAKSDFRVPDVDLLFAYDGFTIITLQWLESTGWCGPGEAGDFLLQHWDKEENRVLIDGRIPMNANGGSLGEGATQGSGMIREAIMQLRGNASDRQVPGAGNAFLTLGGFFFNAQGLVLRTD